jgi:hypothetical protein
MRVRTLAALENACSLPAVNGVGAVIGTVSR